MNTQLSKNPAFKVKAVNLGGWLVTEGWMKPSLFDGILNRDLLDGTKIQLKSVTTGKYLCAENGGGSILVANRTSASDWETFRLWRIDQNTFNFRVSSNQFVGVQSSENNIAVLTATLHPGASESFRLIRKSDDPSRVRIQAHNELFLQARTEELVTADFAGDNGWGDDNPSVFVMNSFGSFGGEYQITNGYGPDRAPQVMNDHWNTYIVEDDFKFMSENGINAVRIPVGWWIASDAAPPPFVGGSLKALDDAFTWAEKYCIQVIVNLHAVPGSQNGYEHSATRDGSVEWHLNEDAIQHSVAVIDFITHRYASNSKLYAVELLNEPVASVNLEALRKYYRLGYDAVRRHSSSAYVIMSNRLETKEPRELFDLASELQHTVIDIHYYNLFSDTFDNMDVKDNISFINNVRSSELSYVNDSNNGPLIFVGEWVNEWQVREATMEEYQEFARAQLEVYGRASFGWAYWSWKNVNNHWSLRWMIENGYITLPNN